MLFGIFLLTACGGSSSGSDPLPPGPEGGDAELQDAGEPDGDAPSGDSAQADDARSDVADAPACELAPEALDFLTSWVTTICDGMDSCCTQEGLSYDRTECFDAYMAAAPSQIPCDAVFHPELAVGCLQGLAAFHSKCEREINYAEEYELEQALFDACGQVLEGRGDPGDPCGTSGDCRNPPSGTVTCVYSNSQTYCQWTLRAEEGDPCDWFSDEPISTECFLVDGLYCDLGHTDTCKPMGNVGEPCSNNFSPSCMQQLECDPTTNTCNQPLGTGDVCDPSMQQCAWDHYCDSSTQACTQKSSVGEACSDDRQCKTDTCVAGICSTYRHTMMGPFDVCAPP